jgi:small subunit ribosomal protein S15
MAIPAEQRKQVVEAHRTHGTDTGSPEVQVAMLTAEINSVTSHMGAHPKDYHSKRGLVMMVGRRNRILKYLARTSPERYQSLIRKLGLRK